jgi:glycine/D-amino acid oxidase-like deaminating enzyme/nitrite reductase/ring-hydroxylating ferredoxin subunit
MNQESTSLWRATANTSRYDPLSGGMQADVAIVGGGITGVTAALLLARQGRSVALLERETIGSGETGNTTAHITEAIDARYHFIRRKYSVEEARSVADASRAALEQIASFVEQHRIDCDFRRLPAYLYTEKRQYVAELKNEASAAREAGIGASFVDSVPLPFATRGAVLWPDQAQFHPGKYLAALAAEAERGGVRIFTKSSVREIREGEPCVVETSHGRVLSGAVVMATNVPISGFTHVHTLAAAYRTYAMAFEFSGEHPDGLFWDTADPYHYTRWQEIEGRTYLIVGGEDHRVGEEEDSEGCYERLSTYVREHFGDRPLHYRWSGQIIEPHGGLPLIGGSGRIFTSTGYSGQGMTFGTLGAMLVTDLIAGIESPWAELFSLHRLRPHVTTREFMTENAHFPAHLASDRLTSRDVEEGSPGDVVAGEARIISQNGRKLAVYRDPAGALHCVSPVCTHMKCDVAWNQAEESWDCPCHGSRFRPDGEVINGPARDPLEKIDLKS